MRSDRSSSPKIEFQGVIQKFESVDGASIFYGSLLINPKIYFLA